MTGIVFVEEPSAEYLIAELARKLNVYEGLTIIPHQGKRDLERSFVRKIPAWRHPVDVKFLITRDNDGGNCKALKTRLQGSLDHRYADRTRYRIIVQELEAWYLGDFSALVGANLISRAQAVKLSGQSKYRNPDAIGSPSEIVERLIGRRGKIEMARLVSPHLDIENNRSSSFHHFIAALKWVGQ